jgi:hypothetical protein
MYLDSVAPRRAASPNRAFGSSQNYYSTLSPAAPLKPSFDHSDQYVELVNRATMRVYEEDEFV